MLIEVGNQLPILLIDFVPGVPPGFAGWESVTDPLDRLRARRSFSITRLGISYRSS